VGSLDIGFFLGLADGEERLLPQRPDAGRVFLPGRPPPRPVSLGRVSNYSGSGRDAGLTWRDLGITGRNGAPLITVKEACCRDRVSSAPESRTTRSIDGRLTSRRRGGERAEERR